MFALTIIVLLICESLRLFHTTVKIKVYRIQLIYLKRYFEKQENMS